MTQLHLRRFTPFSVRGLSTGALTTGSLVAVLLWVTLALPNLPLSRTVGISSDRNVQISLESALLGIAEHTGRISDVAAAAVARRLGLVVTEPLLPTPARLHALEQSAAGTNASAPIVTELSPAAVADQRRIDQARTSTDAVTTPTSSAAPSASDVAVALSPSAASYDDSGAAPVHWAGSDNATSRASASGSQSNT